METDAHEGAGEQKIIEQFRGVFCPLSSVRRLTYTEKEQLANPSEMALSNKEKSLQMF